MIPNFALSLSFEGIRLLHRGSRGWSLVGEAMVDAPDLDQALSVLRKTALELDPAGLRCKIILPNDQIKYIALDSGRAQDDDVRAVLDGATPYAVDDLVYDFVHGGGRTYIAAVAKETLAEAEAFATDHRFAPVSFVAVPKPFDFVGEPFFGPTKASVALLGKGVTVTRDAEAVALAKGSRFGTAVITTGADDASAPPPEAETTQPGTPDTEVEEVIAQDAATQIAPSEPETSAAEAPKTAAEPLEASKPAAAPEATAEEAVEEAPVSATDDTPEPLSMAEAEAEAEPSPEDAPAQATDTTSEAVSQSDAKVEPTPTPEPEAEPEPERADEPEELPPEPVFSSRLASRARSAEMTPPAMPPASPSTKSARSDARSAKADGDLPTAASEAVPVPPRRPLAALPPRSPAPAPTVPRPAGLPPLMPPSGGPEVVPDRRIPGIAGAGPSAAAPVAAPTLPAAFRPDPVPPRTATSSVATPALATPVAPLGAAGPVGPTLAPQVPTGSVAKTLDADATDGLTFRTAAPAKAAKAKSGKTKSLVQNRFASSRRQKAEEKTALPVGRAQNEKEQFTVFGARASQAGASGKPKYLGLILTAILLLFMAGIAAFASFSTTGLAGLLGRSNEAVEASVVLPEAVDTAPQAPVSPVEDLASSAPAALEGAAQPETPTQLQPVAAPDLAPVAPIEDEPLLTGDVPLVSEGQSLLPDPDVLAAAVAPTPAAAVAPGTVLSPAAAERFYAATGVWLRAPRLPLMPQSDALSQVALIDPDAELASRLSPILPPANVLGPDTALAPQLDPPGPDQEFARDSRGFLLATPEGSATPYGMFIFAGSPSVVPPARTGTPVPEAPPAAVAATGPVATDPVATGPIVEATAGAVELAGLRPPVRPEGLAPIQTTPDLPDAVEGAANATPAVAEVPLAPFTGPRPEVRPSGLAPEAAVAGQADVDAVLAAVVAETPDPLATATQFAVAQALRPDPRPQNFARAVEQATARAARAQPAAAAGIAPTALAPTAPSSEADGEPELAAAVVAPSGPIPGGVATAATIDNAINLRNINLIGVYGRPSDRHALVRLGNGRYVRVGVGDSLDGGQVASIGDDALTYVKRGRTYALEIPSG